MVLKLRPTEAHFGTSKKRSLKKIWSGLLEIASNKKNPKQLSLGFSRTNKHKFIGLPQSINRFYEIFVLFDSLVCQNQQYDRNDRKKHPNTFLRHDWRVSR